MFPPIPCIIPDTQNWGRPVRHKLRAPPFRPIAAPPFPLIFRLGPRQARISPREALAYARLDRQDARQIGEMSISHSFEKTPPTCGELARVRRAAPLGGERSQQLQLPEQAPPQEIRRPRGAVDQAVIVLGLGNIVVEKILQMLPLSGERNLLLGIGNVGLDDLGVEQSNPIFDGPDHVIGRPPVENGTSDIAAWDFTLLIEHSTDSRPDLLWHTSIRPP